MALTLAQRLRRLDVRLAELTYWVDQAYRELNHWTFDGQPIQLGQPWPTREGVVHIAHLQIEVPAEWPLDRVRLELNVGGEALLRIRYGDEREEEWGLDPYHQRFPLRDSAFSLEIAAVARLPFGVPNRDARLELARLVLVDPAVERLVRNLRLLAENVDVAIVEEAVVAPALGGEVLLELAEAALAELEWPSETETYLSRVRNSPQMLQIWRLPSGLEQHPPGLDEAQQRRVVVAVEGLQRELRALRSRYAPDGRVALTGQAHLDLAWLWPMEETRRKAQRTAATALGLMARYPEFTFHLTSAQVYAFLEQDNPALFAQIKERAAAGQWEPIGGMWVEPDLNMPAGESLVRQLLYGQRFFQHHFGSYHSVAWLPDCFGFTPALPQLLRSAGIDNFFTIKLTWSETNRFPYDLFWWEGLDGSRVLSHLFDNPGRGARETEGGVGGYNGRPDPISLLSTWRNFRGKYRFPETLLSIGHGDGGGGPTAEMLESVRALHNFPVVPETRFTLVRDYYAGLRQAVAGEILPVWVGELYLELHRGTLTSQGRTKYLHRRAEYDLVAAEVVAGMDALLGDSAPASLEPAWRAVLRNEFHDILPGSSIREVYETANAQLSEAVDTAQATIARHLDSLAARLSPPGDEAALLLVNPDLSPRPVRVELAETFPGAQHVEDGSVVTSTQSVPGLGAVVLCRPAAGEAVQAAAHELENAFLRVTLAEDGTLASVWDKRAEREALAGRGNQLWVYVDKPRDWDAWDIDLGYQADGEELTALEDMQVLEHGPHRAAIRIERRFRHSRIRQDIRLWANSARLDLKTTLDWHDRRVLLRARFPLAVRASHATFECAFGVVQRPTSRNTSWQQAQFEVAGHRFADLSEPGFGVALLNDGKYGHDAQGNELGLSLLRSPVFPDPCADEGTQTFTYSLLPHAGSWLDGGVLMEAEDLNRPLLARTSHAGGERSWQALQLQGLPLGLGTLKVREDGGGLILRTYEPQGARGNAELTLPAGWVLEGEVDLLERPLGPADRHFSPFQVRSWLLGKG